jgi:hypothetical protein
VPALFRNRRLARSLAQTLQLPKRVSQSRFLRGKKHVPHPIPVRRQHYVGCHWLRQCVSQPQACTLPQRKLSKSEPVRPSRTFASNSGRKPCQWACSPFSRYSRPLAIASSRCAMRSRIDFFLAFTRVPQPVSPSLGTPIRPAGSPRRGATGSASAFRNRRLATPSRSKLIQQKPSIESGLHGRRPKQL